MSAPRRRHQRMLVATIVPLAAALVIAGWLIWVRGDPSRSGGFCANTTAEFAEILDASSGGENARQGLAPDVPAIIEAAQSLDVERLQVDTPADIAADVDLLAERLPAASEADQGKDIDPEVQAALARVLAAYLERCR